MSEINVLREIFKSSISKCGSAMLKWFLLAENLLWILSKITENILTFSIFGYEKI